jgi:hypothetical protein
VLVLALLSGVVVLGVVRVAGAILTRRRWLGTDEADGGRLPMVALHALPFAVLLGYVEWGYAAGSSDGLGLLLLCGITMTIIQLVVMGVAGLRANVVSFSVTAIFVVVELVLVTFFFALSIAARGN